VYSLNLKQYRTSGAGRESIISYSFDADVTAKFVTGMATPCLC